MGHNTEIKPSAWAVQIKISWTFGLISKTIVMPNYLCDAENVVRIAESIHKNGMYCIMQNIKGLDIVLNK